MELENQVVSLDLAKKLKELGVEEQIDGDSLFYWGERFIKPYDINKKDNRQEWKLYYAGVAQPILGGDIPAYTVAELLELMPKEMTDDTENSYSFTLTKAYDFWVATWENGEYSTGEQIEDRKARDCLAKMLIYLLENDLCQV